MSEPVSPRLEFVQAVAMAEGAGARVQRLFPVSGRMNLDPFVLWDHFDVGPGAGFPTHPHRGFEAITYIFEGTMRHEDNLGNASTVGAGGAQRFTAGRGIAHSEMPDRQGHTRGIQLWINLAHRDKAIAPEYQQVDADDIPETEIAGGRIRTIVGEDAPVTLRTPVYFADVVLDAGTEWGQEVAVDRRGLVYVVEGRAEINGASTDAGSAVLVQGPGSLHLRGATPVRMMICLGRPHGEPIRQYGPYVD